MKISNWKLNNQKGMEVMKSLQWFRYLTKLDAYYICTRILQLNEWQNIQRMMDLDDIQENNASDVDKPWEKKQQWGLTKICERFPSTSQTCNVNARDHIKK